MPDTSTEFPQAAIELRVWLQDGHANSEHVRVSAVDLMWDEDAEGQPILRFAVSLADPEQETWPVDEVLAFHRHVDDQARELALNVPRYVGVEADGGEELDPD